MSESGADGENNLTAPAVVVTTIPEVPPAASNGDAEPSRAPAPYPKDATVNGASNTHVLEVSHSVAETEYALPTDGSRLHYLEELVAASRAINAILEPSKVAEILALHIVKVLGLCGAVVLSTDDGSIRPLAATGLPADFVGAHSGPVAENIVRSALREARHFATWDMRQTADEPLAKAASQAGIVSGVCIPMFFGGKSVGAVCVYAQDARRFTEDEFHVLSLLAAQGGIALTNACAYRDLRKQSTELRAVFQRVGEALSASLDIGETLHLIVQLAVDLMPADAGAIFLLQEPHEGNGMRLAGMRGLESRAVRRFRVSPVTSIARRALDEHRVVYVTDTRCVTDVAFPALRLPGDQTVEARSLLCVPLLAGDRALGVLEHYSAKPNAFTQRDIQLLGAFAHQATVAIERAQLYAQERSIAQTLQRAFLPDLPETLNGFHIGRVYSPGSTVAEVGGDTYDMFPLPDGRIVALIADVSGQGTYAATLAIMVKYTVRAYALEDPRPSSVLRRLNEAVRVQTGDSTFVTLTYALLDPVHKTVSIASAAHPPPLLWCARQRLCSEIAIPPGLICGFLPEQDYATVQLTLGAGDTLVFYTDGVIEARRGKTMFQQERLERVVRENAHLSAQEIAAAIFVAVAEFVDGGGTDDIALLTLRPE